MKTRALRLSLACAALALLALPVGARADDEFGEFDLKGSHGYEISVALGDAFSEITASKHSKGLEEEAEYRIFGGRANGNRLVTNFGSLGVISVRFKPTGQNRRRRAGCKRHRQIEERGVFEGSIRFHGENGFTRVNAKRARGTLSRTLDRKCRPAAARTSAAPADESPLITSLTATSPAASTAFVAQHSDGKGSLFDTRFAAASSEERGYIFIDRSVTIEPAPAAFAFDPSLNSATVSPPAPFAGSATYERLDDFASRWQGSLTVTLPGGPTVALTGRDFAWSLRRESEEDTFDNFLFLGDLLL